MIEYTDKELRRKAVRAIQDDARAAGVRATCTGFSLLLPVDYAKPGSPTLVAHGKRTDGFSFSVDVAI